LSFLLLEDTGNIFHLSLTNFDVLDVLYHIMMPHAGQGQMVCSMYTTLTSQCTVTVNSIVLRSPGILS